MAIYNLLIKLESPLAISEQRQSNLISTLSYIPAPSIRGAVAAQIARNGGASDPAFDAAIVKGGLRFSAMLPVRDASVVDVMPAPLSLLSCKLHPGLAGVEKGHGVEDSLFINTAYALKPDDPAVMYALRNCRVEGCNNILKPYKQHLEHHMEGGYWPGPSPGKRLQTHAGLDRARHGSAKGILYSREVINEVSPDREDGAMLFQASITGSSDLMAWLNKKVKAGDQLLIGNAISRGLGRCQVLKLSKAPDKPGISARIEKFNAAAQGHKLEKGTWISLTLHTPAFFVDDYLMANLAPQGSDLLQAAETNEEQHAGVLVGLEKIYQNARPYRLTGWNQQAGFPRTTEMGLQAGSVMVFRAPALTDELIAALTHLESAGIGLNREAGFGKVSVCDSVHTDLHEITIQLKNIMPKPQES